MKKQKTAEEIFKELINEDHFRVAVFGSARTKENEEIYKQVYDLAYKIGQKNIDIVTGGGPGLMLAASEGHQSANPGQEADSIGLIINLPWEAKSNAHLDIKKNFDKFSGRLDHFMALSNVVVVMPGGIGTCLELFYSWQLVQVHHIKEIPIILVGEMWEELIKWVKKYPLKDKLISEPDLDCIHIAKNNDEAMRIIEKHHQTFITAEKNGIDLSNTDYLFGT